MILISNYSVAILFTIMAMICWGSWANTMKATDKGWRFELYYWDLVIGIFLLAVISAFTVGSMGDAGRTFSNDLAQTDLSSILYAIVGGVLWNAGNMLLVAAIAIAGLSVAFPIGGGLAWVLGIVLNYVLVVVDKGAYTGNQSMLWPGVAIIIVAILLSSRAYKRLADQQNKPTVKGISLSVIAGLLIACFYPVTVKSLDNSFVAGGTGSLTPYTSIFFFSIGIVVSTFIFNPIMMRKPVEGEPVKISAWFAGSFKSHILGVFGGMIWMLGMIVSFMAVSAANPAVSYALSNAAPVVAMIWGIFVWKEFKGTPKGTNTLLTLIFVSYLAGLLLITLSNT